MAKHITKEDRDLLEQLGVDTAPAPARGRSAKEQRIIAGFEEIQRFAEEHGRPPQHGENNDIFERLYAVRLDRLRESKECRDVLAGLDPTGLLDAPSKAHTIHEDDNLSDEDLLATLGVEPMPENDVTQLVHVRSREEIKAAEEVAQRTPCEDFGIFKPLFEQVQGELESGQRQTRKFKDNAEIQKGHLFILDGQKVFVAEMGETFINDYGRTDRRLRVVYDNGTESDLLLRSLQRALNKDKASRRITEAGFGPLFADTEEDDDLAAGYIYVLRSKSDHPFLAENRSVIHKIGVTVGDVKARIAGAKKDPTYLLADVEIVATFKLANVNRKKLESLLHKIFAEARLDVELKDRFGSQVEPKEWFLVPLPAIEEAIQRIKDGSIGAFRYDPKSAEIVPS